MAAVNGGTVNEPSPSPLPSTANDGALRRCRLLNIFSLSYDEILPPALVLLLLLLLPPLPLPPPLLLDGWLLVDDVVDAVDVFGRFDDDLLVSGTVLLAAVTSELSPTNTLHAGFASYDHVITFDPAQNNKKKKKLIIFHGKWKTVGEKLWLFCNIIIIILYTGFGSTHSFIHMVIIYSQCRPRWVWGRLRALIDLLDTEWRLLVLLVLLVVVGNPYSGRWIPFCHILASEQSSIR